MKKLNMGSFICIGGALTAITVLFQSAPIFLPGVGLGLSPLSTLPIAIAGIYNIPLGFTVFFSAVLILSIISIQETIILLFTTGLLGIVSGIFLYRKGIIISILFSGIGLTLGIMILTYIICIPGFVSVAGFLSVPFVILIFLLFSLLYGSIWNVCLKKLMSYLPFLA